MKTEAMSPAIKAQALDALEGMRLIVRREMLIKGIYRDPTISNPNLTGAICGGHKHCAIGSLWVASGVKPRRGDYLPGVDADNRRHFLRNRPALQLALAALNEAAVEFAQPRGLSLYTTNFPDEIERLFEGHYDDGNFGKRDLLRVISTAKRKVKA